MIPSIVLLKSPAWKVKFLQECWQHRLLHRHVCQPHLPQYNTAHQHSPAVCWCACSLDQGRSLKRANINISTANHVIFYDTTYEKQHWIWHTIAHNVQHILEREEVEAGEFLQSPRELLQQGFVAVIHGWLHSFQKWHDIWDKTIIIHVNNYKNKEIWILRIWTTNSVVKKKSVLFLAQHCKMLGFRSVALISRRKSRFTSSKSWASFGKVVRTSGVESIWNTTDCDY